MVHRGVLSVLIVAWLAVVVRSETTNWPQFRGANVDGLAEGNTLPEIWSTTEHVVWKADIPGWGWSSPVIWGNKIFLTSAVGEQPREKKETRDAFGRMPLGQACLLARQLVETGMRCVTIDYGSWDTHQRNLTTMKHELLPTCDTAVAALVEDLSDRGLLDSTVVWSTGEMGRTPTTNKDAGRDHWGKAMSMLLAGGGIQNGQVLGATDKQGADVTDGGVKPEDVAATVLTVLGIARRTEYRAGGRPITLIRDGDPIRALCG